MSRPDPKKYEQKLMQQRLLSDLQSQAQQAGYRDQLAKDRAAADAQAAEDEQKLKGSIFEASKRTVPKSTVRTSPVGLLGNPMLSSLKLSG